MKWRRKSAVTLALAQAAFLLSSCATPLEQVVFEAEASQLQVRSIQSRTFELTDRIKAMRAVIATLQDLDFVLDKADSRLGLITATKLNIYNLHITIMVHERGNDRLLVRANCQVGIYPVQDPVAYQEFFASLEKNLFLTVQQAL
jgi:hypothetical protein